jgi:hypothetical protein
LPIEYSIAGRRHSATASRKMWIASASRATRCVDSRELVIGHRPFGCASLPLQGSPEMTKRPTAAVDRFEASVGSVPVE